LIRYLRQFEVALLRFKFVFPPFLLRKTINQSFFVIGKVESGNEHAAKRGLTRWILTMEKRKPAHFEPADLCFSKNFWKSSRLIVATNPCLWK